MNGENQYDWLNTRLSQDQAKEFAHVQEYHGIHNRAEMVRWLIRQEYRRITTEQTVMPTAANHQAPCA